jgi:hypothetical protein
MEMNETDSFRYVTHDLAVSLGHHAETCSSITGCLHGEASQTSNFLRHSVAFWQSLRDIDIGRNCREDSACMTMVQDGTSGGAVRLLRKYPGEDIDPHRSK